MDVIYFLAKTLDRLARGLVWLLIAAIGLALRTVKNTTRTKAQPAMVNQGEKTAAPQPAPPLQQSMPDVHVHVHLNANDGEGQTAPSVPARKRTSAEILNTPDHGIYITTGSHLIFAHPRGEELLEQLDKMLFIAAHRDGDPFTVTTPLDTSKALQGETLTLPPLAPADEGDFIDGRRIDLPAPDGKLWMLAAGKKPQPLATGSPS